MRLRKILFVCVCALIVFTLVDCKGGRGGGFRGGGSRGGGHRSGSSGSGGIFGWFKGLFGGSSSSSSSSHDVKKNNFDSSYPKNQWSSPSNTRGIGFEELAPPLQKQLNTHGLNTNFYTPKLLNNYYNGHGNLKNGINYHKNDFSSLDKPKVKNTNAYYTPVYLHTYPRRYYGRNSYHSTSGSNQNYANQNGLGMNGYAGGNSVHYNHCLYYGGFNNKPLSSGLNNPLNYADDERCKSSGLNIGDAKNKLFGPNFGLGLLGGAATGMSLGLLLGMGLNSLGSTPWNYNNEAFSEWLKLRVQQKISKDPSILESSNETSIINGILNETNMCPGEMNTLAATVLNTMVPCNATNIKINKTYVDDIGGDCKFLVVTVIQDNSFINESLRVEIKQNNLNSPDTFENLTYDIVIKKCHLPRIDLLPDHYLFEGVLDNLCSIEEINVDYTEVLNKTISHFWDRLNITMTQFNTLVNNTCVDKTDCNTQPRDLISTFINWSILPKDKLMRVKMSQCSITNNKECDSRSGIFCENPSKFIKEKIETDTFVSAEDFANINIMLHQSKDVANVYNYGGSTKNEESSTIPTPTGPSSTPLQPPDSTI